MSVIMPVPETASVGGHKLPRYLAEPLARRTALLYISIFLVGLVSTLIHLRSTYFGEEASTRVGTLSTTEFVHRLIIYSCMAGFHILTAAWYPTSVEVFFGHPIVLLMNACNLICSLFWCYDEVTDFEVHMPNWTCMMIHRVAAIFLLLSMAICYVHSLRGTCTWHVIRTLAACESIVLGSGVLALRCFGPPSSYPPGVSFTTSFIIQTAFYPLPHLVLTRANRLRVAELYRWGGLHHVNVRLKDVQEPVGHAVLCLTRMTVTERQAHRRVGYRSITQEEDGCHNHHPVGHSSTQTPSMASESQVGQQPNSHHSAKEPYASFVELSKLVPPLLPPYYEQTCEMTFRPAR